MAAMRWLWQHRVEMEAMVAVRRDGDGRDVMDAARRDVGSSRCDGCGSMRMVIEAAARSRWMKWWRDCDDDGSSDAMAMAMEQQPDGDGSRRDGDDDGSRRDGDGDGTSGVIAMAIEADYCDGSGGDVLVR